MSIGARVKELRKSKGWNQTELGEKINLSFSGVSLIEADKNSPSIDVILKLSELFEVSADYLLTGNEEPTGISEEEREILEFVRKDVDFKKAVTQAANFKKKAINYLINYQPQQAHAA